MALETTTKQKDDSLNSVREQLKKIVSHEPETLGRDPQLGSIDFSEGTELFTEAIRVVQEFSGFPHDLLTHQQLNPLVAPLTNLATRLADVASFGLSGRANPEAERDQLLQQVKQTYDAAYQQLAPHLGFLAYRSADAQETVRRSARLLEESDRKIEAFLSEMTAKKEQMDAIVQAAREAASKIGIAKFATRFEEHADKHERYAKYWLAATGALAALTATAAALLLFVWPAALLSPSPVSDLTAAAQGVTPTVTATLDIQRIVGRLVIISLFYFATLWTGRNYRSHRHLAVTNRHKQNALTTFETFVEGSEDKATKDGVLLEATHSIFAPTVSGYLGKEDTPPPARTVQLLASATKTDLP